MIGTALPRLAAIAGLLGLATMAMPATPASYEIIASKRASGREKDLLDLPLLERFREEYERGHRRSLRSAAEIASKKGTGR